MNAQPEGHPREPDTSRLLAKYVAESAPGGGRAGPHAADLRGADSLKRLEVLGLLELAMRLLAERELPRGSPLRFPLPRE
jgi:hypothetical protein